jgi:20S proteasome subunit beta 1
VEFDGGVVIGADSRTTTGSYIANRVTDKLTSVHEKIWCCRSGSAADTQAISDYVHYALDMHAVEIGEAPEVKTAASIFQQVCYNNKDSLLAGIIVAGWDKYKGGSVYNISLGGAMVRQPFAIGGSGSTYIYGYCDATFVPNMTRDQCLKFVRNCKFCFLYFLAHYYITALALAMARDGSSGGVIRTAIIDAQGVERQVLLGNELPVFYGNSCSISTTINLFLLEN